MILSKFSLQHYFVLHTDDIKPWMLWGYYVSPMSYGQNAIVINEFLDERWSKVRNHFSNSCFSISMSNTIIQR
jgi:murein tripeptide amidase MpaA